MPDNAPDQTGDKTVDINFTAYTDERGAIQTITFGGPSLASTVLISAISDGDALKITITSDVDDEPRTALTSTIEYLETVVQVLRDGGTSEAAWAAKFDAAPDETPTEAEIASYTEPCDGCEDPNPHDSHLTAAGRRHYLGEGVIDRPEERAPFYGGSDEDGI